MPSHTSPTLIPSSQPSLLIFDLDGTLIDSVPDLADAVNATLQALGNQGFDEDTIRHWVGNGARTLIARALSGSTKIRDDLDDALITQALNIFFEKYAQNTCVKTRPYAGVDEGLRALKTAGYHLALVTNKPIAFVPAILQAFDWQALFDVTLGGDSLPVKKPDPAPLLHVCETLGFSPAQSYMIGDSSNDVLAGHNAGMATLALSYGYNYGQDIRDFSPTQTFDRFTDLVSYLISERIAK